ncbi:MAG: hypothetical protein RLZZ499_2140, partial [Cyanobacteriota bacterium]
MIRCPSQEGDRLIVDQSVERSLNTAKYYLFCRL